MTQTRMLVGLLLIIALCVTGCEQYQEIKSANERVKKLEARYAQVEEALASQQRLIKQLWDERKALDERVTELDRKYLHLKQRYEKLEKAGENLKRLAE